MQRVVVLHIVVRVDSESDADAALRVVTQAARDVIDTKTDVRKSWRDPYLLREVDDGS